MLTQEDNELICRTGPGTPMGRVLRRYWHPCLLSADLPDNDCRPVRVRLLGEDLVAFRDSEGRVGLIDERCPHQGVSMYYGIPAGGALMCIHHGWKFDVDGNCVGMPSSEPESQFMETVHTTAYPVVESAGMVWTYMGPPELQPLPPDFLFNRLPASHVIAARVPVYCNYLQSIEGNIDSSHLGTLHRRYSDFALEPDDSDRPGTPSPHLRSYLLAHYRYAVIHVQDTDYGFRLIGIRPTDAGHRHLRITSHVFPVCSMIASPGLASGSFFIVPTDDENCMRFFVRGNPDRPFTAAEREAAFAENTIMDPADPRRRLKRADNDYMIDREAQKTTLISGILPNAEQDYAVTESMGPIMDRTRASTSTPPTARSSGCGSSWSARPRASTRAWACRRWTRRSPTTASARRRSSFARATTRGSRAQTRGRRRRRASGCGRGLSLSKHDGLRPSTSSGRTDSCD